MNVQVHLYRKHRDTRPNPISDDHVVGDTGDMHLIDFDNPTHEDEGGVTSSGSDLHH